MSPPAEFDRLKQAWIDIVRAIFPTYDYLGSYRVRLVSQSTDYKTVGVQPDNTRLPGLNNIPLRVGIPQTVAAVQPGAYLTLQWDGGDPASPYCMPTWETGAQVTLISIADGSTSQPAARKTDPVTTGTLYFNPGTSGATLTWTAPGGVPGVGTAIPLSGLTIKDGSGLVKIG